MNNNSVSVFISGDFCPINRIESNILNENPLEIFGDMIHFIRDSDISITNLECPLTIYDKAILKTGPSIKGNPKTAKILAESGFNLITLANNHIFDFGKIGLENTIELLKDHNLKYVGAELSGELARKTLYIEKNGLTIAFINITENEWSTTHDNRPGANPINPILNFYQIKEAKRKANKVIVITHGGHELYRLPSINMKRLFRYYVDVGADSVINHHPHYFSGYEIYNGAPIFYSLGNFIFDNPGYRNNKWNTGISVLFKINIESINFEIISFEQCNEFAGIKMHNQKESDLVLNEITELNKIIQSDEKLIDSFECHANKKKREYYSYLEPINNRYLLALQNRNILPRLFGKKNKLLLKNIVNCESHRELILKLLDNETSHPTK